MSVQPDAYRRSQARTTLRSGSRGGDPRRQLRGGRVPGGTAQGEADRDRRPEHGRRHPGRRQRPPHGPVPASGPGRSGCLTWARRDVRPERAQGRMAIQPVAGWMALVVASTSAAVGRSPGSLARQRSTRGRTSAGSRRGSAARGPPGRSARRSTRCRTGLLRWRQSEHRAQAEDVARRPDLPPSACSGDMNPGEPTTAPVWVSELASAAREMPKSITRGPSSASSTFDGFRSRCTTPAAWMASAPPPAQPPAPAPCRQAAFRDLVTTSASDGPGT